MEKGKKKTLFKSRIKTSKRLVNLPGLLAKIIFKEMFPPGIDERTIDAATTTILGLNGSETRASLGTLRQLSSKINKDRVKAAFPQLTERERRLILITTRDEEMENQGYTKNKKKKGKSWLKWHADDIKQRDNAMEKLGNSKIPILGHIKFPDLINDPLSTEKRLFKIMGTATLISESWELYDEAINWDVICGPGIRPDHIKVYKIHPIFLYTMSPSYHRIRDDAFEYIFDELRRRRKDGKRCDFKPVDFIFLCWLARQISSKIEINWRKLASHLNMIRNIKKPKWGRIRKELNQLYSIFKDAGILKSFETDIEGRRDTKDILVRNDRYFRVEKQMDFFSKENPMSPFVEPEYPEEKRKRN